MSAITYSINQLKHIIDPAMLEVAFPLRDYYDQRSLEARIRHEIIDNVIRQDVDTYGAREVEIAIQDCEVTTHTDNSLIIKIPPNQLGGLYIAWPIEVGMGTMTHSAFGMSTGNPLSAAQDELAGTLNTHVVSSANLIMLDSFTVWCPEVNSGIGNSVLRVMTTNDREFSNIQPADYRLFSELVVWAVKRFMYSRRYSNVKHQLMAGFDNSMYTSIVESFSDADERYSDFLKRWGSASKFADPVRKMRMVSIRVP